MSDPEKKINDPETLEVIEGLLDLCMQRETQIAELTAEVEKLQALSKSVNRAPNKTPEAEAGRSEAKGILVVDDNKRMRTNLVQLFQSNGFDVVGSAKDEQEAFELNRLHLPAVVTYNTAMRDADGNQAIRQIKGHNPEAKVIVISHALNRENILQAIKAGASEYVAKPVRPERLLQVVKLLLAS